MSRSQKPVTVSIVSHLHAREVRPLLRQLSDQCGRLIDRVILTLNVPEQFEVDVGLAFPVDLIRNTRPRGFGANHNAAFKRNSSPWFLVLNPDITIEQDVLTPLLAGASVNVGLMTPRIWEPERIGPEPYRAVVTPAELIRRRSSGHVPPPLPHWIAGMFMLVDARAYEQVGGFDERFFMYCEDVDLCLRLQLAGWRLQVAADLAVLHQARRQSHSSPRAVVWHLASLLKLWTSKAYWRYLRAQKGWHVSGQPVLVSACGDVPPTPKR